MKFEIAKVTTENTDQGQVTKYRFKCREDLDNTHTLVLQFWGGRLPAWAKEAKLSEMDPENKDVIELKIVSSSKQTKLE